MSVGVVAIDGTKIKANASMNENRTYREIVNEILREAEETDRREDELYGDGRGDELPEQLRTAKGRRAALREAKRRLAQRKRRSVEQNDGDDEPAQVEVDLAPERFVTHSGGRRNWFREARRELEARRERERRPIPRDRDDRLLDAARRLEENQQVELAANEAYENYRESGRDTIGRRIGKPANPDQPPALPKGKINTSDPDSRVMRTQGTPPIQGYNAQTTVNDKQIILAAEVTVDAPDFAHLEPMFQTTLRELARQGVRELPEAVIADAGYWHTAQMQRIAERGIEVLIPPDGTMREGKRPGWENGLYALMRERLSTDESALTSIGSPTSNDAGVTDKLSCAPSALGPCQATETLTTTETTQGGTPVALSASTRHKSRTVIVATKTVMIEPGKKVTVTVKLNATGRKLLARFGQLPVTLKITLLQNGRHLAIANTKLTVKTKKK